MIRALLLIALLLVSSTAGAAGLEPLLPREARLAAPSGVGTWMLLPLPDEVLTATRPDRGDLRLFDEAGVEQPYLLLEPPGLAPDAAVPIPLSRLRIEHDEDGTRLVVARPGGLAIRRLSLETSTVAFERRVTLRDLGPGGAGRELVDAVVHRAPGGTETLTLALGPRPEGDRLELVIDDGDSPPLANLVVVAEVARPVLASTLAGGGVLRFGGGRLAPPRYDLERVALRSQLAEARWASLEAARDNPRFDPVPAFAFAMRAGPEVDGSSFRFRRELTVLAAREGVSRMSLGVDDLGRARADLADLRVVDDQGRAFPHLVEPTGERDRVPLTIELTPTRRGGTSVHRLPLPAPHLAFDGLELLLGPAFVDRPYRLVAGQGEGAMTIAAGQLRRHHGEDGRAIIALDVTERVSALALEIEDGDDAPVELIAVSASVPRVDLFVTAPPGRYWLLSGAPEMVPARHELARARPLLLDVPAAAVRVGSLEDNPAFEVPPERRSPVLLWAVLALAVCALAVLTLRAVGEDENPEEEALNA